MTVLCCIIYSRVTFCKFKFVLAASNLKIHKKNRSVISPVSQAALCKVVQQRNEIISLKYLHVVVHKISWLINHIDLHQLKYN